MMHVPMDGGSSPRSRRCHVSLDAREHDGGTKSATFSSPSVSVSFLGFMLLKFLNLSSAQGCEVRKFSYVLRLHAKVALA